MLFRVVLLCIACISGNCCKEKKRKEKKNFPQTPLGTFSNDDVMGYFIYISVCVCVLRLTLYVFFMHGNDSK